MTGRRDECDLSGHPLPPSPLGGGLLLVRCTYVHVGAVVYAAPVPLSTLVVSRVVVGATNDMPAVGLRAVQAEHC